MGKSNVARIMVLYKQHYRSQYNHLLDTDFSCFGYYDGMDIIKVKNQEGRLSLSEGNLNITDTWYYTFNVKMLNGSNSQQTFVLFYTGSDNDIEREFWHDKECFLATVFVQTVNNETDTINEIQDKIVSDTEKGECSIISYRLIDNADFILFIKGRKYSEIAKVVQNIQNDSRISYINMILSVHNDYLKDVNLIEEVEDEEIEGIRLEISAKNDCAIKKLIKLINEQLKDDVNNTDTIDLTYLENNGGGCFYRLHHSSYVIHFPPIRTSKILRLFKSENSNHGALTHLNGLYGEYIFNIATFFEETYKLKEVKEISNNPRQQKLWCEQQLKYFKNCIDDIRETKDENLYFYYQALLRTLNMLSQYEAFDSGHQIFNIIFPSLQLLCEHLKSELSFQNSSKNQYKEYNMKVKKKEKALSDYLQTIDNIIYHVIHTDQNFLMIPGYTSMIYEIPAKLCLFYMAFMTKVSEILKEDIKWKYRYYLEPTMDTSINTYHHEIKKDVHERIVNIRLPQRMLFVPRTFLITISHEIAHYVGDEIRQRKFRLECMMKNCASILLDELFQIDFKNGDSKEKIEIRKKLLKAISINVRRENFGRIIIYSLNRYIKRVNKEHEQEGSENHNMYHESIIKERLCNGCLEILRDEANELFQEIDKIDENLFKTCLELKKDISKDIDIWIELRTVFEFIDLKRKQMLAEKIPERIVKRLINLYKEVFSDLVAVYLLEINETYYLENFPVAKGRTIARYELGEIMLRLNVLKRCKKLKTFFVPDEQLKSKLNEIIDENGNASVSSLDKDDLKENISIEKKILGRSDVFERLIDYIDKCSISLEKLICSNGKQFEVKEIRNILKCFYAFEKGKDENTFSELFERIDRCINEYNMWIEKQKAEII